LGPRGQRLREQARHGHWQTLTFLAVVIMDNLVSHKGYAVRRAIRRREASVPAALQFLT